ncbi:tRNA (adenosine(37)-N6)-threonylcarbamoyltransferase complex transferase subunit TsaD [bacterium]|nr:tRNA (adenosine(37)-N6)-threonylcarbamoyltransferase complex transferase subunit TsaD [bacterium]
MNVLGIETSCDETAVAVYAAPRLLSSVVASQTNLHAKFGGVVPELSARAHIERLPAVTAEALAGAGCGFGDLGAVAVTVRPGLLSALLCGLSYARGLSMSLGVPLVPVDHVKAHVAAAFLREGNDRPLSAEEMPALALVASGGHTLLIKLSGPLSFELLGTTRDDAVGEAFDKVGQLLGLPFPGGPAVEKAAEGGDPEAFRFPVGKIRGAPLDFSFSGLKTSVLYTLHKIPPAKRRARRADLAASFQSAAIRALTGRAILAVRETGIAKVVLCGGVAANRSLRRAMAAALSAEGADLFVPPMQYCTDSAAQIALMGSALLESGATAGPDLDASTTSELFE